MSGKQAKAKRKSAKKQAAAQPAPVVAGARLEEFIIGNVRCFAGEQRVPIRPITLLVGENSTGKTTVLGGYRMLSEMLSVRQIFVNDYPTAFNKPPFPMGTHGDIARKSGGGEFCLGMSCALPDARVVPAVAGVKFFFGEKEKLPRLSKSVFTFDDGEELSLAQKNSEKPLEIAGPGFRLQMGLRLAQLPMLAPHLFVILSTVLQQNKGKAAAQEKLQEFLRRKLNLAPGEMLRHEIEVPENVGFIRPGNLDAVAPIRSKPKPTYSILDGDPEQEGGDVPALMFRMRHGNPKALEDLQERMSAFGEAAGMFSDFRVVEHGSESGGDFHLELNVREVKSNIMHVGYGVSQIYPMLAHVIRASQRDLRATFLFQQPEVHLHPRAQAEVGTFFVNSARKGGHTFLVETHSDFIVDRIRTHVAKGDIAPDDVSLLYFEPQKSGGAVKIHRIELNRNGEPAAVLKGYRDFFLHETQRVLGLRVD